MQKYIFLQLNSKKGTKVYFTKSGVIQSVASETVIEAVSKEKAIELLTNGGFDFSTSSLVPNSEVLYSYDKSVLSLEEWQENVIFNAIGYEFISKDERVDALCIINKYSDDIALIENEVIENTLGYKLALASQL